MSVLNARLGIILIVAAKNVVVLTNPEHTMHDVLTIVPAIKGDIPHLETSLWLGSNDQQVTMLTQKGHHAGAHIGIDQLTLLGKNLFESH